ncbi:MAG TPA: NAD(P)/FAD-dependent oxidoreductase [Clostridia bacterium]|nr:NAD(P)/FAD-dependent oxidoreductase [Clostridia bacterium]
MDKKRVIIIGAGPAGLTAAYQLLKNSDIRPVILEESAFAGGISRTAKYNNNRMDLGGHRFFTKIPQVMKIWEDLAPVQGSPSMDDIKLDRTLDLHANGPDPEKEDKVFLIRKRVSRIFYLRKFFDYPISLKLETFRNMGFIRTVKVGFGYIASAIYKRKENSLEDFYINRFGKPLYEMFFEDYTEKVWGEHPSKIAPDWGSQRVKGLSLLKIILSYLTKPFKHSSVKETSLIEEFYYPKFGPGQLWETMANEILRMGGDIFYNSSVTQISFSDGNTIRLQATGKEGEITEYTADALFSSMPVKDLIKSMGDAAPQNVQQIASELPYRDFITVGLLLNKLLIKNMTKLKTLANIVPDCWIYVQDRDVKLGRIQVFNNWSPYLVADPENTVWIGLEYFCNEDDEKWSMGDQDFISYAVSELIKLGIIDGSDVLDSTVIRVKKAYPAYFGSYKEFDTVRAFLNGIDNLFCIGRNGQHRYNNMDHSMLTAMEAVHCYLNDIKSRDAVWNVNTEEAYHETKTN